MSILKWAPLETKPNRPFDADLRKRAAPLARRVKGNVRLHEGIVKKAERSVPRGPAAWLEEIRAAYADAQEAIPFGPVVGLRFDARELFHLAPAVAVKFRRFPSRSAALKRATEAALTSYVANLDSQAATLSDPRLAFAFCYLASHFGLGLVDMATVETVMRFVERHKGQLSATGPREA